MHIDLQILSGHTRQEVEELIELMEKEEYLFANAKMTDENLSADYHESQLRFIYLRLNKLLNIYPGYEQTELKL